VIGHVDAVEARRLARSIIEARKEGRRLKPLTNTRLLSPMDAVRIQDALIDLRLSAGEELRGWSLVEPGRVAPILSGTIVDGHRIKGVASTALDVRAEPALAIVDGSLHLALRAIDRPMGAALAEDAITHGHGLVGVAISDEMLPAGFESGFEITMNRDSRELTGDPRSMREEIESALAARERSLGPSDLLMSAALLYGAVLARRHQVQARLRAGDTSVHVEIRHL
jgi:hypothetical protein